MKVIPFPLTVLNFWYLSLIQVQIKIQVTNKKHLFFTRCSVCNSHIICIPKAPYSKKVKNCSKNQSVFCDTDDFPSLSSDRGDNFWRPLKKSLGLAEEFCQH